MLSTTIELPNKSPNLSDQNNSRLMDDLINDLEVGASYNPPRHVNKRMKKRKQLDALLKFRSPSSRSNRSNHRLSNEALLTSEDELFLSDHKHTPTKSHSKRYRRWCSYTRHILSFCLVCIFMIICVGLAYANIELKNEVQNLSLRVTEIDKRFSNYEINRIISTIDQIKTRLNVIERWNISYIYHRLQKLQIDFSQLTRNSSPNEVTMDNEEVEISSKLNRIEQKSAEFSEVADELDKLSRDADDQTININDDKTKPFDRNIIEYLLEQERRKNAHQDTNQLSKNILSLNESLSLTTAKWHDQLNSLRMEIKNLNQSIKIQELTIYFQSLTDLVHNSSDKTSAIITALQSDLDKLRNQIETCKCLKESLHLKPSVVETDQLKQALIAKPTDSSSPSITTSTTVVSKELKQSKKIDYNKTIDIVQIINQPPFVTG